MKINLSRAGTTGQFWSGILPGPDMIAGGNMVAGRPIHAGDNQAAR